MFEIFADSVQTIVSKSGFQNLTGDVYKRQDTYRRNQNG